ncbi:MAG: fibronectin type III domain-containing protein [Gammaproteobacteria bacterium]|nr:fibronectin type III domain-containing protein [Gammaproteobacteria bacterium]
MVCYGAVSVEAGRELLGDADRFYVIVTSDPQYPYIESGDTRLPNYGNDAETLSSALVKSQYKAISQLKKVLKQESPAVPLRGIIINGDLTNFGHDGQLGHMKELWEKHLSDTHIFMGLGNHDYENNVNDCHGNNCANRMWDFMLEHQKNGGLLTTDLGAFDQIAYSFGLNWHRTPESYDDRRGPLWYSFKLGGRASTGDDIRASSLPGVRFIQLQNYADYRKTWNEGRGNETNVEPNWVWLENQLATARYYGEAIVFLDHVGQYIGDMMRMARQYGVAAAFSGHVHTSLGEEDRVWWYSSTTTYFKSGGAMEGNGIRFSGYQADGSFLLVEFDLPNELMKVWKVGNFLRFPDGAGHRVHVGDYPLYPVTYRTGNRKTYSFPRQNPLASGNTIIQNGSNKKIRVKETCIGCSNTLRGDWIQLAPTQRHSSNLTSTTGYAVHGYDIDYYESGQWKDIHFSNPAFSYLVEERCVNVANFESQLLNGPVEHRVGWNSECYYSSHPPNSPAAFDDGDTASFSIAENNTDGASVGTVAATDADGDSLTYSLASGGDNSSFSIGSGGGIRVKAGVTLNFEAKSTYSVTAQVTDAKDGHGTIQATASIDDTIAVTINVTDVDERPDRPDAPTVAAASRTSVVVSWTAVDTTGKPRITYVVDYRAFGTTKWHGVWVDTDTSATLIRLTPGTVYEARVRARNAEGGSPWSAVGSGSTNPNSPPSFVDQPTEMNVEENSAVGTLVGTVEATDADGDSLSYSLFGGGDPRMQFEIGSTTGEIRVRRAVLNHEGAPNPQYTLEVSAHDGFVSTTHNSIAITVTDVNEPPGPPGTPTVEGVSRTSVTTSWTAPDMAGKPAVTDYDVQYRASGAADWTGAQFDGTGTEATIPGLSEGTAYDVQVRATNAEGASDWSASGSGSTHANNPPAFADQPASASVAENSAGGTAVATVAATDADGDALAYSLDSASGAVFDIDLDGNIAVRAGAALDHEATPSYAATVTADDGTDSTDHAVAIGVADVAEPPDAPGTPAVAGASKASVTASWTAPDMAGKPALTDYDVQYQASGASGWTDAGFDGTGTEATIAGLSADTAYSVQVRATNAEGTSGWSASGSGTTNANAPPVFTGPPTAASVPENSAGGTAVATVAATDADAVDTLAYSLDGASGAVFDIDADGNIAVRAGAALDHEATPSYAATVTADDGTATATHAVAIRVEDVAEPPDAPGTPAVAGASKASVTASWTAPDMAGKPALTDYDVQYQASGASGWTDAGFDGTGTEATIAGLSADTAYSVQVRATNAEGTSGWSASGSGTTNANAPPVFTGPPTAASVPENSAGGTAVATVAATDADAVDTLAYSLDGASGAVFDIDADGNIAVRAGAALDHEATPSYAATVTADDGTDSTDHAVAIGVEDAAEPPAAPAAPTVVGRSLSEVSVRWTAPDMAGKPAVTDYDVQYRASGAGGWTDAQFDGTGTAATIGGLGEDTAYDVQVRARNAEGTSGWSTTGIGATKAPLTAAFVDVPAEHDVSLIRFELRFSEEFDDPPRLRARLREAFRVTNGSVREANRLEPGKNRRWTVGVRPDSHDDVTVELPETTDCDAADAVCAADGRPLSNSLSATVKGSPPLTAEFVDVPTAHDGSLFRFELRFSEEFKGTAGLLARLRDKALRATNGTVRETKRVEPGKNRRWTIGVRPDSHVDVTVELPATTDCSAADAVCAADGRPLSNSLSATVEGPSASNAVAAALELLQGPLVVRVARDGEPVQPLPVVASRPTMAVAAVRTDTSARTNVLLRVATGLTVLDIEADLHTTAKESVAGTGVDTPGAFRSVYLAQVPSTHVRPDATFSVLVDPDNAMAESVETDNELALTLSDVHVVEPPTFKVKLVPIAQPGAVRPLTVGDHGPMLAETLALLPIGAYKSDIAPPLRVEGGASARRMLDDVHAVWNREAGPDEFYHGLYRAEQHWPEGLALVGGRVALSPVPADDGRGDAGWFVANGIAHNFGIDEDKAPAATVTYGWSSASERFFSSLDREIMDPSGGPGLYISRWHYERAMAWMGRTAAEAMPADGSEPVTASGSVALTGGLDASGVWYLHTAEQSPASPREASAGEYSAVIYDEAGTPLLQQPLRIISLSTGPGGVWALRVPSTAASARALRIWGPGGDLLLDEELVLDDVPSGARGSP